MNLIGPCDHDGCMCFVKQPVPILVVSDNSGWSLCIHLGDGSKRFVLMLASLLGEVNATKLLLQGEMKLL